MDIEGLKNKVLDLAIRGKLIPLEQTEQSILSFVESIKNEKERMIHEEKRNIHKQSSFIYKKSNGVYYENEKEIEFVEPLNVASNFLWLRGKDFLFPMESKRPTGQLFQYIDIDAINNKTNSISYKEIETKNAPSRASRKVYETSTLFSMVRPYLRNIAFVGPENSNAIASTGFYVCTPMSFIDPNYLFLLMKSEYVVDGLNFYMKGDNSPSIKTGDIEDFLFPFPPLEYQKKVVSLVNKVEIILNKLREDVVLLESLVENAKRKLLESIFTEHSMFNNFIDEEVVIGDVLLYEQPGPYIVSSTEYSDKYKIPVLTPGKSFILGYTNETTGIYHPLNKVIIFDDFTTASRLIDFDFKVKSSAMKILHVEDETKYNIDYFYYLLQTIHINSDTHKRFWISEYAPIKIKVHNFDEQNKIVSFIDNTFKMLDEIVR